jgi:predicted O-methyltransferase YrrM
VSWNDTERLSRKMVWQDDEHLAIGETGFFMTIDTETWKTAESTSAQFFLMKNRWQVLTTLQYLPEPLYKMIELGILKGGSIALYEELYSPARLVGVDIEEQRVQALDQYVKKRHATDRIRLYYGTDQADRRALQTIADENFGGRSLDLVIDDGSHHYEPSKTSLNVFLPCLRPGGIYLIEDWAWAHWQGDREFQETFGSIRFEDQKSPMTKLIFEAVMLAASRPDIISGIVIDGSRAILTRGVGVINDMSFDITTAYRTGRWSLKFSTKTRPLLLDLWRGWLPLSFRRRIPRSIARWAHECIPH